LPRCLPVAHGTRPTHWRCARCGTAPPLPASGAQTRPPRLSPSFVAACAKAGRR
jgi:hypothetical protein